MEECGGGYSDSMIGRGPFQAKPGEVLAGSVKSGEFRGSFFRFGTEGSCIEISPDESGASIKIMPTDRQGNQIVEKDFVYSRMETDQLREMRDALNKMIREIDEFNSRDLPPLT